MKTIIHFGIECSPEEIKKIVYEHYETSFRGRSNKRVQMLELLPSCDSETKILDYGCGYGTVSKWLVDRFNCQVDAVDSSENELEKAKLAYGDIKNINFVHIEDFSFPANYYDIIVSSHVIEHVHNVGNYLYGINRMLKTDGHLLVSLPNIVNLRFLTLLAVYSEKRAIKRSKKILKEYSKPSHHINGWDPQHFITLNASCGFELERYRPTGYISLPFLNLNWRIPILRRWSFSMAFLFRKVKAVKIEATD